MSLWRLGGAVPIEMSCCFKIVEVSSLGKDESLYPGQACPPIGWGKLPFPEGSYLMARRVILPQDGIQ